MEREQAEVANTSEGSELCSEFRVLLFMLGPEAMAGQAQLFLQLSRPMGTIHPTAAPVDPSCLDSPSTQASVQMPEPGIQALG